MSQLVADTTVERPTAAASWRLLFRLPFRSPMDDHDIAYLRSELGMSTHFHPKHPAVRPPLAFVGLDSDTGLFLACVDAPDQWVLECRTWGKPTPATVRRWQLHATYAASQLDRGSPTVAERR